MRVLIADRPWQDLTIEQEILSPQGVEIVDAPPQADEETLVRLAANVQAISVCWAPITAQVIQAASECKIIARTGIGLDNIDIPAATEAGIMVTNVPDYCVTEVADHALALLLSLARNIAFFHLRTKRGEYDLSAAPPMLRLSECTLGLFGLGRIAQALAVRAQALGLRVIAHSRSGNDHGTGIEMVTLDQLLSESDFLSLHVPLSEETRGTFQGTSFDKMKPGAVLINTSRGGLVDEAALWEAIQSGRIAGAGLDVFDPEPPDLAHPLFRDERVIVTPHAAFVSQQSVEELRRRSARQIATALAGGVPENWINRHD